MTDARSFNVEAIATHTNVPLSEANPEHLREFFYDGLYGNKGDTITFTNIPGFKDMSSGEARMTVDDLKNPIAVKGLYTITNAIYENHDLGIRNRGMALGRSALPAEGDDIRAIHFALEQAKNGEIDAEALMTALKNNFPESAHGNINQERSDMSPHPLKDVGVTGGGETGLPSGSNGVHRCPGTGTRGKC